VLRRLQRRGFDVVLLVVGQDDWDRALLERFGQEACGRWVEIFPDVLRAPPAADALMSLYADTLKWDPKIEEDRRDREVAGVHLEEAKIAVPDATRHAVIDEVAAYIRSLDRIRDKGDANEILGRVNQVNRRHAAAIYKLLPREQADALLRYEHVPLRDQR
jgi:hypothetical protein